MFVNATWIKCRYAEFQGRINPMTGQEDEVIFMTRLGKFLRDNGGATAMEYGIAALLISVVAIMSMDRTGKEVNGLYTEVGGAVGSVAAPGP